MKPRHLVIASLVAVPLATAALSGFMSCSPPANASPKVVIERTDPKAHEKLVRRLFEQMEMAARMEEMVKPTWGMLSLRLNPLIPSGFVDEVKKRQDIKVLIDLLVPIYMREYDLPTLEATVAFGDTEAGKKFLAGDARVMQKAREFGSLWATEIAEALLTEMSGKK